jgi:hypothetical protein
MAGGVPNCPRLDKKWLRAVAGGRFDSQLQHALPRLAWFHRIVVLS